VPGEPLGPDDAVDGTPAFPGEPDDDPEDDAGLGEPGEPDELLG